MKTDEVRSRIGVVVVAFRSAGTIGDCVRSCLSDDHVVSVVVVDNSGDRQTEAIITGFDDPRLVYASSGNVGFAAGCNRGAALLPKVEWVAFVNPDVTLSRPLSELVARSTSSVSLLGANVPTPGSPLIVSARDGVSRRRELLKATLGAGVYNKTKAGLGPDPMPVEQVSGALMLLPHREFTELGGFDERFELYYEDVDICARAAMRGGCYFVADDWGTHHGGASSSGVSRMAFTVGRVSRTRYLRKHRPGLLTEAILVVIAPLELIARAIKRTPEGNATRRQALRAQWREWLSPGSVRVLQ